jgi:predicted nucleotidyltransferase
MATDAANRTDRDQLLSSLIRQLEGDDRVRAVWLAGSLGRGNADDLSDIDIWIAVADDLMGEVSADPERWVQSRCDAVMSFSIPQNGPPGGAYVFSLVRCPHGLQQVDWYWTRATDAERPNQTMVVFEREPVLVPAPPLQLDEREVQDLTVFWCRESLGMAHIATKGIRRGNPWVATRQLQMVADCIGNARFVHQYQRVPVHDDERDVEPPGMLPVTSGEQFRLLRELLALLDPVLSGLPIEERETLMATRHFITTAIDSHTGV